jgi:signal peptidase I
MKFAFGAIGAFLLDIIQTIVLALSIFVISYLFLFQPHQVKGSSMVPNFHTDEFLLTDKISYRFNPPKQGDVIVFKAPPSEACAESECEYIKRIIGVPGDKIRLTAGYIYVNDKKLNEPYLDPSVTTYPEGFFAENQILTLKTNEYFVCGDNRPASRDGRAFGPIKRDAIIGKAWLRYWPPSKIGFIPNGFSL